MKRTNPVLDGSLLAEARRLSGERTYSATVDSGVDCLIAACALRRGLDGDYTNLARISPLNARAVRRRRA